MIRGIAGPGAQRGVGEELQASEAKYRSLVEHIPGLTYIAAAGKAGGTLYISPQVETILGFTPAEWLADPAFWAKRLHPDDRERVLAAFARQLAGDGVLCGEYRMLARDGGVRWFRDVATLVRDERGEPLFLQGVAIDITDRKQAEEALRDAHQALERRVRERTAELTEANQALQAEIAARRQTEAALERSERQLRGLVQSLDAIVWEADAATWRFTFVSQQAEAILGYPVAEWLSEPDFWINHVHPGDRDSAVALCREATSEGRDHQLEYRALAADGRVVWLSDHVRVVKDAEGRVRRLRGIMVDITVRRRAVEALVTRTRQLEAVRAITQEITQEMDLTILLGLITRRAADLVGASLGTVSLWDEAARVLIPQAWHGFEEWRGGLRLRLGEGVTGTVAERRKGLIVNDYRTSPYAHPVFLEKADITAALAEPLLYQDRLIGVLTVSNPETGRLFTTEDSETLAVFAAQAAVAIENARLYRAEQRRAAELRAVMEVTREIVGERPLEELLQSMVTRAVGITRAHSGTLYLWDEAEQTLRPRAWVHLGEFMREVCYPLGHGITGTAAESGGVIWNEYANHPRHDAQLLRHVPMDACMSAPLRSRDRLIGVLTLNHAPGQQFCADDLELLEAFAGQAAVAIESARLYAEAERRRRVAETLAEVSRLISQSLDPQEVAQRIVAGLLALLGGRSAGLFWMDPESGDLKAIAHSGELANVLGRDLVLPRGTGAAGRAVLEVRPVVTHDLLTDPRITFSPTHRASVGKSSHRAALAVPLLLQGRVIGALGIGYQAGWSIGEEDVRLAQAFADQASIVLENARLYKELRRALAQIEASQQRVIQTERLRALGELSGGVAHDFNNTLCIILGRAQMLLKHAKDPALRRQLQLIERVTLDGGRTVQRIQEFARMVPARPFESVDLNRLVREGVEIAAARWRDEAQSKGIRYDLQVTTGSLPPVMGDPSELREALMNLVFNALDAMPDGGTLTIRTYQEAAGRRQEIDRAVELRPAARRLLPAVLVEVADTGIGMNEETRRRCLEPYFTTKGERGSGLGLSVTYGIATRHGGTIDIQSRIGKGSAFTIRLPAGEEVAQPSARPRGPRRPRRAKILVIDDELHVRQLLTEMLTGEGHFVVACSDGSSGLTQFQEGRFDLVLTDLAMPGLSGWEVVESIRALDPEIPIAMITGWTDRVHPEEARAKGVDSVLSKPFTLEDLGAMVARALRRELPDSSPPTRGRIPRAARPPRQSSSDGP